MPGTGKLVTFLLGQTEWSGDVDYMGEWTIWMSRRDGHRIGEMDGGDGSTEDIDRGGSGLNLGR